MHTMLNLQNMQNSLLLTERTSALWAVYGYFYWMYRRQSSVFCSSCFSLLSLFLQICKGYSFTVPLNVRSVNILRCGFSTDLNSDLIQHKIFSKWPFFRRVVLKGVQKNFWFNFDFCFTTVSMCARKGRKIKNEKVYRQFKIKAFAALTDQRQNWKVSILQILCACIKTESVVDWGPTLKKLLQICKGLLAWN